jgi:hypothetical protein
MVVTKYVPVEGAGSYTANQCCVRVSGKRWMSHTCSNRATVIVTNDKGEQFKYCGTHNPEKVNAREQAKRDEWDRKFTAQKNIELDAQALCRVLAKVAGLKEIGSPTWYSDPRGGGRYTGSITLSPSEVKALIAKLQSK